MKTLTKALILVAAATIGSTPNSHFMRKAAESGRGTFTYIGNVNEVKDKLDGLFRKLEHPVLNNITIDAVGWSGLEQFPAAITDLYEGEPIVLALKADSLPPQPVLRGQVGTTPWSLPVSFNDATAHGGLSVYWARQKISALMDETYKGGAQEAIRNCAGRRPYKPPGQPIHQSGRCRCYPGQTDGRSGR